jgi:hypothetical protein
MARSAYQNAFAVLQKHRQMMDNLRHLAVTWRMPNLHLHQSSSPGFYRRESGAGIHEERNQQQPPESAQPIAWRKSQTQQKGEGVQTIHNTFYVNMGVDTTSAQGINPSDLKDKLYRLLTDEAEKLGIDT